ncbi:MAG TPA: PsbP-related protein, partial [Ktedonobacteraceae bacterium]
MKQLETSLTNNRSNVPLRELHVKVWDKEETVDLTLPESGADSVEDEVDVVDGLPTSPLMVAISPKSSTPSHTNSNFSGVDIDEEEGAEELPTNPLITSLPQNTPLSHISSAPATDFGDGVMLHSQIEDMATRPYVAQPRTISPEIEKPIHQQRQAMQASTGITYSPVMQRPVTPVPLPQSQIPPAQPVRQTPPLSMPVPPLARPKKNNRTRLAIVFGLLFILLLGGVIAWVIVTQPFAVPEITKTTQNFKNTSLGVSLQYPQNWAVDVNKQIGTVNFYDDNHTDQVNINVVVAGNQSMNQYMNKTMSSLGMTGQRTQAELTFAGATWQQIQGSVLQSGANYTATLLFTMHRERY